MKAINILLITIIGISLLMAGCVDNELTSEQIKQQILAHQDDVQSFTCNMVMSSNNETMVMNYMYKQPNMIRMEYTEPSEVVGQVMVSNGTYIWMYDPTEKIVRTTNIPESAQTNRSRDALFLKDLVDTCAIVPTGVGTVSGRQCHRITATPEDAAMPMTIDVWLDKWNWMLLKIETYQNDELVTSMEYQNVEFNVDIPNSTFEFEIPEGATVESTDKAGAPETMTLEEAQDEVLFNIKEPAYLPQGYEMESVMVTPVSASEDGVVLIYTNATDENMLSAQLTMVQLVESVYNESAEPMASLEGDNETITVGDGYNCTMTTMETPFGKTIILQWNDGARDYMLAGSLDREEMINITNSI
ncbi:MAG: outer-membrane lipoprotein carrier protein LolA [Euryarchaeota archaeon]|nr:outer-membrane lipoprotein carrier protein LolA [Euryarchaeota archaeon]